MVWSGYEVETNESPLPTLKRQCLGVRKKFYFLDFGDDKGEYRRYPPKLSNEEIIRRASVNDDSDTGLDIAVSR